MATMDVLKALDELKDAGVEERSARAMVRLVSEAVEQQAATKIDLERESLATRSALARATTELRGDIAQATTDLRGEIAQVTANLRGAIAEVTADLRGEIAEATAGLRGGVSGLRLETPRGVGVLPGHLAQARWRGSGERS